MKLSLAFCPFLFGSCLNAHESQNENWPFVVQRVPSPLSELFLAFYLPFPLLGAPFASVLVSTSRIEMKIFVFLLEMSLGPSTAIGK